MSPLLLALSLVANSNIGYQLGICTGGSQIMNCRPIGRPLPDEQLCNSLRDSIKLKVDTAIVSCTKVLIEELDE